MMTIAVNSPTLSSTEGRVTASSDLESESRRYIHV